MHDTWQDGRDRPLLHKVEDGLDAVAYNFELAVACWKITLPAAITIALAIRGFRR